MALKRRQKSGPVSPNTAMIRRTLFLMIVCGIVAFLLLAARLFKIQIIDHDYYEAKAVDQQLRETTVTAKRGSIYDRNMNILAMSASVSNVYLSPAEMAMYGEDPAKIAEGLSGILDMDAAEIYEKCQAELEQRGKPVAVDKDREGDGRGLRQQVLAGLFNLGAVAKTSCHNAPLAFSCVSCFIAAPSYVGTHN